MKVDAPKGYHWMKDGKSYKIMKDPKEGYKPHKGSSKSVDFPVKEGITNNGYTFLQIKLMSFLRETE